MKTKTWFLIGLSLFTFAPVVLVLSLGKRTSDAPMVAAILGAVGGATFLMMVGAFLFARSAWKGAADVPLEEGEQLLHTVPANHFEGLISQGGQLRITTQRLVFQPHRFNFKVTPVILGWAEVKGVAFGETADFMLLKAAAAVVAHAHIGSDMLRVRHGASESRFIVFNTQDLPKWLVLGAASARL